MSKLFYIKVFLMLCILLRSQSNGDSLLKVYKNKSLSDTIRLEAVHEFACALVYNYPDSAFKLADDYYQFATKRNLKLWQGCAELTRGNAYYLKGEYNKALDHLNKSLSLIINTGRVHAIASVYSSLGTVYYALANYPRSLDYHFKSLKLREGEPDGDIGGSLLNIGAVYSQMENIAKANEFQKRALDYYEKMKNNEGKAMALSNISANYFTEKNYKAAMSYQLQSLAIERQNNNRSGIAISYDIIGLILMEEGNFVLAEYNMNNALALKKEIGDAQGQGITLGNIALIYLKQNKFNVALQYAEKSKLISHGISDLYTYNSAQLNLVDIYSGLNNYKSALFELRGYIKLKDSLFEDEHKREIALKSMQYDFDKKETDLKTQQAIKNALDTEEKRKQYIVIYSVSGILLLVILLAGVIFKSLQANKRKNKIITEQKQEVEKQKEIVEHQQEIVLEKQKEILDSITYAKRLQDAILPPNNLIKQHLSESFVLYKPKDIVAGDFYWMELLDGKKDNTILIAAADCTGHGVPGAMVSVVCSNALNRAVKEFGITAPGEILDKVRELVIETFEKSEDEVKDGMDISLCSINKKTNEVLWSGANNPLWYVQKGELKELTADKQPIGKYAESRSFKTHKLELEKGTTIYIFTDGYPDQFGGPKGKKFKYKQLETLLLSIHELDPAKQKEKLNMVFEEWKGDLEQVDDVTIIGIKL